MLSIQLEERQPGGSGSNPSSRRNSKMLNRKLRFPCGRLRTKKIVLDENWDDPIDEGQFNRMGRFRDMVSKVLLKFSQAEFIFSIVCFEENEELGTSG